LQDKLVTTLLDGLKSAGQYEVTWNAAGQSSGMYLVVMKAPGFKQERKSLLLK